MIPLIAAGLAGTAEMAATSVIGKVAETGLGALTGAANPQPADSKGGAALPGPLALAEPLKALFKF